MMYALKDIGGNYFLEIQYHSECGYYPAFSHDIIKTYDHAMKAKFDRDMLIEVYNEEGVKIVPVMIVEENREIETSEFYK